MTASEGQKQVEPSKQHAGRTTRFRHIERQVSSSNETSHDLPIHTSCVLIIKRRSDRHAPWISRERNLRSKIRWFTEFCNSHYLSQLATFFIDARAKRSTVRSCHVLSSLRTSAKQYRIEKYVKKNTTIGCTSGADRNHLKPHRNDVTPPAWYNSQWCCRKTNGNDPSAGSPTETLLRLLLPLNDQVWATFRHHHFREAATVPIRRSH